MQNTELWLPIEGFSDYEVSDLGSVRNVKYNRILTQRLNNRGHPQVTLYRDGRPYTRQVSRLVGVTFLPAPHSSRWSIFHLDEDFTNNNARNLSWRPRWFLHKHAVQRKRNYLICETPVRIIETDEVFDNPMEAAKHIGGLEVEVFHAAYNTHSIRHMGYSFEFIKK